VSWAYKGPKLWPSDWILHHDHAPAHKPLSVKQFLAVKSIWNGTPIPFSWFSYELLLVVSKNNSALQWRRFQYIEHIQKCDDGTENYFTTVVPKCFQQWQHHLAWCIAAQGGISKVTPLSKLWVYRYACNKVIPGTS